MNRRQFVILTAATLPAAEPETFPLGIASTDPAVDGIHIWTRVNPAVFTGGSVEWTIAADSGLAEIAATGLAPVSPANDYTVNLAVTSGNLRPFSTYYYQFRYNGSASRVGRFKTLPAPGTAVSRVRLGFLSCQDYTNGYYTALAGMAQEPLDYVVHLGDYIYETVGDPVFQTGQVRPIGPLPSGGVVAANLEDYRFLYRTYRSDRNLQLLHESFAVIPLWDDHEYANDAYGDAHPDNTPAPGAPDPALRAAATQAWKEYMAGPSPVYRSFAFGNLAELIVTDERLYRDGPPCGLESANRYLTTACAEVDSPSRTMLGAGQKQWFIDKMLASTAVWKVWANELMCMPLKAKNDASGNGDIYLTLDAWDGYRGERTSILAALRGMKNLVAITGDIHSFGAGYLQTGYENAGEARVGVEFVGGSVTSANFAETIGAVLEPLSAPVAKDRLAATPIGLLARVMNPHLDFFHSAAHGYGVLELTPAGVTCTLRQVSTVKAATGTMADLAKFFVPRGEARIVRVG